MSEAPKHLTCPRCGKTFPLYMLVEYSRHVAHCENTRPDEPAKPDSEGEFVKEINEYILPASNCSPNEMREAFCYLVPKLNEALAHIERLEGMLKERTKDVIHTLIERHGDPQYKTSEFALYDVISAAQQLQTHIEKLEGAMEYAYERVNGWREVIAEFDDRPKSESLSKAVLAVLDQIDIWKIEAKQALKENE